MSRGIDLYELLDGRTPAKHLAYIKPCKSWDFNYQPQLVIAGFQKHQQYGTKHTPTQDPWKKQGFPSFFRHSNGATRRP